MKLFFSHSCRSTRLGPGQLRAFLFLILVLGVSAALPQFSRATRQSSPQVVDTLNKSRLPESVSGEILVRFRNGAAAKGGSVQPLAVAGGRQIPLRLERLGEKEIVPGLRLARVAPEDTANALQALAARADVLYAEPNYILQSSALPNDPRFPEMSNLKNTGQQGTPGNDIAAEQAWDMTTGSDSVVVGVVDTGVDIEHPDLKDNIWRNTAEIPDNGIDDDGDGYVDDVNGLRGDDEIFGNLSLPFNFRFFGQPVAGVSVSTNGVLYFNALPIGTDAFSTVPGLKNQAMIAGMWDDLRTDRRPEDGVYMVTPDPDRVIFRWQAVTFDTPLPGGGSRGENPVSFEIELQRSGDIVIRYGAGNTNVRPIVGISGGEREPYFVGSHSSENSLINLTNAPSVSFTQPRCSWSLDPTAQTSPASGYSDVVSVDTGGACTWTAVSNASWISVSFGTDGIGSGIASYGVAMNDSTSSRSGTITIAGRTFTVNQAGTSCSYLLGTTVQGFSGSGGLSGTSVTTQGDCPWTATSNASWITITSPASGAGNGGISFLVASNPGFARTGTIRVADQSVTINQEGLTNPIDDTTNFVRQHYFDFLNRQPDAAGLEFWTNNINSCGGDVMCREVKRIDTSAAYFLSIEFQETGYLVHRFYRASFGQRPLFTEFLVDTQAIGNGVVVNQPGWQEQLETNKQSFANLWVTRGAFTSIYDALSNAQYVDTLIANTGVTFSQTDRDALIDVLNNQAKTRAQVLRIVAEHQLFYDAEYNAAFVEMQYFGYLRRNPQDAPDNNLDGYNFWLNKLNEFGGDFRRAEMVKAFLVSGEYRQRFIGP